MTFEAVLADYCRADDVTYRWSSSSDNVHIVSPNESVTEVTIDSLPRWERFSLMVEACVGNVALTSTLTTTCGEYRDPRAALALSVPEVMFVNNDDDDGDGFEDNGPSTADEDDVATCTFTLTCPTAISGALTFVDVTGFTGDIYEQTSSDTYSLVNPGDSWSLSGAPSYQKALRFDAKGKSAGYRQSKIKLRWTPDNGETQDIEQRFTVVEPIVEPICAERKSVTENGVARTLTVNPCGVGIGRDAYFRVQVLPQSLPDSQIVWSAVGAGTVSFPNGNTGREVKVRGVGVGDVELQVQIGDSQSNTPSFPLRVVENRTVKLSAWIVADGGDMPCSVDDVRGAVSFAEDVYAQIGVTFDIGNRIVVTNLPTALVVHETVSSQEHWSVSNLVDLASGTGGVELYFVNQIVNDSDPDNVSTTLGVHTPRGIVVGSRKLEYTVAHEIGHAFGFDDIYASRGEVSIWSEYVCYDHMMFDWNNGCDGHGSPGARYYKYGMTQESAIDRLLMNGSACGGLDIAYGLVWGVGCGLGPLPCETMQVDVGAFAPSRSVEVKHE